MWNLFYKPVFSKCFRFNWSFLWIPLYPLFHLLKLHVTSCVYNMYRSSHQRCSLKKMFLKILIISQENICVGVSFLIKLQAWKRDFNTDVFLWNEQNFTNTYFEEQLQTIADQMICNKILLQKIRTVVCI